MAVFVPKVGYDQSGDAKTLVLYDQSSWTDGNYDINNFTRTFVVKNSAGTVLQEIDVPGVELSVEYPVSLVKDQYLNVTLKIAGSPDMEDILNIGLTRFYDNRLDCVLIGDCCGKGIDVNINTIRKAQAYSYAANRASKYIGKGPAFDKYINSANLWINQVV